MQPPAEDDGDADVRPSPEPVQLEETARRFAAEVIARDLLEG